MSSIITIGMVEPHNITRLKAREQELYARGEDAREHSLTALRSKWFEAQSLKISNPREKEKELAAMDDDVRLAAEQLTRVRRERLREQYVSEMAAWQKELAALGLALAVKR